MRREFLVMKVAILDARRRQLHVGLRPEIGKIILLMLRQRIEALVARTGADEVMVTTVTHDYEARARSYRLLAAALAS